MMKKAILSFLLTLSCFSLCLCSCATVEGSIKPEKTRSDLVSVDVYYTEKQYDEGNIDDLKDENTPIYTLDPAVQDTFLNELEGLTFKEEMVFLPIPMDGGYDYTGYIVSLVYADGSYCMIAEHGQFYYYTEDGGTGRYEYDHSDYCGDTAWSDFVAGFMTDGSLNTQ